VAGKPTPGSGNPVAALGRVREFGAVSSRHSMAVCAGCVGNDRAVAQEISSPSAGDRPVRSGLEAVIGTAILCALGRQQCGQDREFRLRIAKDRTRCVADAQAVATKASPEGSTAGS
jgi:hypothetical protein